MWCHQYQTAYPVVFNAPGINGCNACAIAMAQQYAVLKPDCIENIWQHIFGFPGHIIHRAGQIAEIRLSITGPGIGKNTIPGRLDQLPGKIAPQCETAKAFMQHDNCGCLAGSWAETGIFECLAVCRQDGLWTVGPVNLCHDRRYLNLNR